MPAPPKTLSLLAYFFLPLLLVGQASKLPPLNESSAANYRNYPIAQLNLAYRQQLGGRFEDALQTYDAALAWQADWVPTLTGRAELLTRMGRRIEARRDIDRASRINPEATAFFMAKGQMSLMPFLALYPQTYYETRYGISPTQTPTEGISPRDYYLKQRAAIAEVADTSLAVRALKQKVDRNTLAAQRSIDELPRDYPEGVKNLLLGNLAMLEHDYTVAINYYSAAELTHGVDWPELYYNRGLASILQYAYLNGCSDLRKAAEAKYAPARVMFDCLCNL